MLTDPKEGTMPMTRICVIVQHDLLGEHGFTISPHDQERSQVVYNRICDRLREIMIDEAEFTKLRGRDAPEKAR